MLTITTLDRDLARLLEPLAPRPDLRLNAVRKLSAAGLRVAVNLAPILPLINDSEPSLDAVAKASARAGAVQLSGNVVFLKAVRAESFLSVPRGTFPGLFAALSGTLRAQRLSARRLSRHDSRTSSASAAAIISGQREDPAAEPELWPQDPQLTLFS